MDRFASMLALVVDPVAVTLLNMREHIDLTHCRHAKFSWQLKLECPTRSNKPAMEARTIEMGMHE